MPFSDQCIIESMFVSFIIQATSKRCQKPGKIVTFMQRHSIEQNVEWQV